jgi:hypothetical protein
VTAGSGRLSVSEFPKVTVDNRALYVYTSCTTGLPKAAIIRRMRLMNWTHCFAGMIETGPTDVPQHRRRGYDRRRPRQWRLGGHSRQILRRRVLGRPRGPSRNVSASLSTSDFFRRCADDAKA